MNEIMKAILGNRKPAEALDEQARAIREIIRDTRIHTYDQKSDPGYVTAKILPVVKGDKSGR